MSAVGRRSALTQVEAARVLQTAMARSGWAGLVVGVALATGWTVAALAQALRPVQPEERL